MNLTTTTIGARRLLRRLGIDLVRARPNIVEILHRACVETVFDVGANVGDYGQYLRRWGYRGRIISFEPLSTAYQQLEQRARKDSLWETHHVALGNYDGEASINASELSVFSSFRKPLPRLASISQRSALVSQERAELRRLDSLFPKLQTGDSPAYLKVDTQGYEREVVEGAHGCLGSIRLVQLEASLHPLYEGEALLAELITMMQDRGFALISFQPAAYDRMKRSILQADCIFAR